MKKIICMLLTIMLPGCVTMDAVTQDISSFFSTEEIKYYPHCYEYIDKIEDKYDEKGMSVAIKGALIGGAIGAGVGAISGDYKTAIIAGTAGAGIGAISAYSYVQYKKFNIADPDERFLSYLTDIDTDSKIYNEASILINEGIDQFNKELKLLNKNKDKYTQEEFTARLNELKNGITKLEKFYQSSKKDITTAHAIYSDISNQEKEIIESDKKEGKISYDDYSKLLEENKKLKKDLNNANKKLQKNINDYDKLDKKLVAAKKEIERLEQRVLVSSTQA